MRGHIDQSFAIEALGENDDDFGLGLRTRLEMVSNRTHRKRRNGKNNFTFSRIVRSVAGSEQPA
jgi:hypothetical protein